MPLAPVLLLKESLRENLLFGLGRNSKSDGFLLGGVLSTDHTCVSLDEDQERKSARSDNGETHEHEGSLVLEVAESKSKADSSGVSSGSNDSRDDTSDRRINIRDDSVRSTFGSLDKEGEEDHDSDGSSKRVGLGKNQDKDTLSKETDGLCPKTSTHTHVLVTDIRHVSSKSTGKQVHESKDGSNGGSRFGGEFELVLEVKGSSVIHGKLDTEAAGILDKQEPGVNVESTLTERRGSRNFGHLSVLLELGVVTLRGIIRDHVDHDTSSKTNNGRNNGDSSPGKGGVTASELLEKREKSRSHDELGNTSSKVTPSSTESIGSSDYFLAEHAGSPVLAHDKGSSSGSDEETKDPKAGSIVDKTGTGGRNGSTAKNNGHRDTGSPLITGRAKDETHENCSSDSSNGRSPDLLLGEGKIISDFREKRGDGEPDEEGNEETPPGHVEGTHVGTGERAELDSSGSVILVGIDINVVRVVLLPLGL